MLASFFNPSWLKQKTPAFAGVFLLFAIIAIYSTGLHGPALLDDTPNLTPLTHIHNFNDIISYSFSNLAGHRPVSYFSFALQANSFQQGDLFTLKLTNLFIHSINAFLFFLLCKTLLAAKLAQHQATWLAMLSAGIWFAHPLHANTVLYTVQRMTLLATSFSLMALLFYCHNYHGKRSLKTLAIKTTGFALLLALSVFSKENGILTALFLWPCLFLLQQNRNRLNKWVDSLNILLPMLALLSFFVFFRNVLSEFRYRPFTLGERLITEAAIVVEYLDKTLLPWPSKYSVLQDGFPIISEVLSPLFIASLLVLLGLIAFAWFVRKQWPVLSFAIAWFFIGHLLESTFIPLELYFDHRNYQPSMGIVLALVYLVHKAWQLPKWRIASTCLTVLFITHTSICLLLEVRSWQSQEQLIISNLQDNPQSQRAWQELAQWQYEQGQVAASLQTLAHIRQTFGSTLGNELNALNLICQLQQPTQQHIEQFITIERDEWFIRHLSKAMRPLLKLTENKTCQSFTFEHYLQIHNYLLKFSMGHTDRQNLLYLLTQHYLASEDFEKAWQASSKMPEHARSANFLFMQMQIAFYLNDKAELAKLVHLIKSKPFAERSPYQSSINNAESFLATP